MEWACAAAVSLSRLRPPIHKHGHVQRHTREHLPRVGERVRSVGRARDQPGKVVAAAVYRRGGAAAQLQLPHRELGSFHHREQGRVLGVGGWVVREKARGHCRAGWQPVRVSDLAGASDSANDAQAATRNCERAGLGWGGGGVRTGRPLTTTGADAVGICVWWARGRGAPGVGVGVP